MRIIETYSLVSWICDTVSLRVNILKIRRKGYLLNHWKKMPCVTNTLMSPVSHFRSSLCSSSSEMVLIDRAGFQRGRNGASEGKEGRRSVWEIEEFESSLKDGKMPHTGGCHPGGKYWSSLNWKNKIDMSNWESNLAFCRYWKRLVEIFFCIFLYKGGVTRGKMGMARIDDAKCEGKWRTRVREWSTW